MSAHPEPDLAGRAHTTRVVVVGGGIAGLTAAWECARIGMPVTLVEARGRIGGDIETAELDGIRVDLAAEAFSASDRALGALIDELDLRDAVEPAADASIAVAVPASSTAGGPMRLVTLPANRAGIPANTWAAPVRQLVGTAGVWRAYLDRLRPPLTIGRERRLGALVRARMGARVRDRLVAPITVGTYGLDPDGIDVDLAVPGLSAALTRVGSLAGAVAQLLPDSSEAVPAPARRAMLRGGLSRVVEALVARLLVLDTDIRVDARATQIVRTDAGWLVTLADEGDEGDEGDEADADASAEPLIADIVVLATDAQTATHLLAPHGVHLDAPSTRVRDVVTLVMDATATAATASAPPATVYPVPGTMAAASVIDATAAWASLAAAAGAGRRVLRVTLDPGDPADPADPIEAAAREVRRLWPQLGAVRAAAHRRVALSPPASALGHAERTAAARARISRVPGIVAVGEWLAGSGVAGVVADAANELERVRHDVLWGRS